MKVSGGVKVGIEDMVFDSWGIEEAIEQQRVRFRTETRSIQQVLRSYRGCRSFLDRSTRFRGGVEIAFKKNAWKARQIARYRGGVGEVLRQFFKTVFRGVKNTDMNAIQHTTQPMIQSTQKSLKKIYQSKKFWAQGSPKHTHILNKSKQFYISKISHDSLVSIHYHI